MIAIPGGAYLPSAYLPSLLLRAAAALVPAGQRTEWFAEWNAELWHIRSRRPRHASTYRKLKADWIAVQFCRGAFQDALWLRRNRVRAVRLFRPGSPSRCGLALALASALSFVLCLVLPGARRAIVAPPYPHPDQLVLISAGPEPKPSIRRVDYLSWKTTASRLFTGIAFYTVAPKSVHLAPHAAATLSVVRASEHLFDLLGVPIRPATTGPQNTPYVVIADAVWREYFHRDPDIAGRRIEIAGRGFAVAAVAPPGLWQLPGRADLWLLQDDRSSDGLSQTSRGFVVARTNPAAFPSPADGRHWIVVPRTGGWPGADRYDCVSLSRRVREPFSIFLFTLLVACLALPATTPLPLGEYPAHRGARSASLQRWSFLAAKLSLLLPLVHFGSIDLAYNLQLPAPGFDPSGVNQYLHLAASFFGFLFAFRWALRDQRRRCPVCLRRLTNPARVGEASRNFLAWNGTELICAGGHGLLHIPEIPTSWFSTQRWLYLDASWAGLFVEPRLPAPETA